MQVKKTFFVLLIALVLVVGTVVVVSMNQEGKDSDVAYSATTEYSDETKEIYGKFTAKTTIELLKGRKSNTCYSPVSLYSVLCMAAEGNGRLADEIVSALGVKSVEDIRDSFISFGEPKNENNKIVLLNSVWANEKDITRINQEVADNLVSFYHCEVFHEVFKSDNINSWVSENTNGLIKNIVDKEIEYSKLLLINTLYFKGGWNEQFEDAGKDTFNISTFEKVEAEYIERKADVNIYIKGDDYLAVPYSVGDGAEMIFILPDGNVKLDDIIEEDVINEVMASMSAAEDSTNVENIMKTAMARISIKIPKFSIENTFGSKEIKTALVKMGIENMADVSSVLDMNETTGLAGNDYDIIQKTKITLNEEGIEGAASTIISGVTAGGNVEYEDMNVTLDRPFAFILEKDGMPLFIGTVYNPAE